MGWETLLLLACPLMMLFCMKGMFSGNKEKETKGNQTQQSDLQSLQIKMADLIEQNHKLTQEVENLKNQTSEDSNIVKFKQA
ncbi:MULTISPECIES: DUF2933 domain-containing protein [Bacillaceae]|uniref:DUF2933 domain-containing protein n=1 Tax=Bacillaceae TaxID=186817 RepID=UPI000BFC4F24|nr:MULTISPECIES: DUF2933 domain-containing protein [Bacillaceae]MCM3164113.1 DUF2933 domain-containing protein [Metabacillus litoralis]PGT84076.1 hypothetical protein COD11_11655 [Bacillus sp. AFS040349]UGB33486.1 DUF2933 domain-containing protein [Metabacillus sp. B2-18]